MCDKKIVDYKYMASEYSGGLAEAVRSAMEYGFQPFGNPIVIKQVRGYHWAQAMVKYDSTDDPQK